jgi:hypothetical protein
VDVERRWIDDGLCWAQLSGAVGARIRLESVGVERSEVRPACAPSLTMLAHISSLHSLQIECRCPASSSRLPPGCRRELSCSTCNAPRSDNHCTACVQCITDHRSTHAGPHTSAPEEKNGSDCFHACARAQAEIRNSRSSQTRAT